MFNLKRHYANSDSCLGNLEKYQISKESITVLKLCMSKNEKSEKHSHQRGQLFYLKTGSLVVVSNEYSYVIYPNYCIWMPPYSKHKIISQQQSELYSLYIAPEYCNTLSKAPCIIAASPLFQALLERYNTMPSVLSSDESIKSIFLLLIKEVSESNNIQVSLPLPKDKYLLSICNQLLEEPLMGDNISELINNIPISYRHAIRLFKKQTNMSFVKWRSRLKLHIAVMLLMTGYSVTWVSYEVGYRNVSSFSQAFKKEFGAPPKQFSSK